MNLLDLLLVIFAVGAAVGGYRLGFIARVASWVGLALGVAVGSMILPLVFRRLDDAGDVTMAFVAISVLAGTALIGQAIGLVVGSRLHVALGQATEPKPFEGPWADPYSPQPEPDGPTSWQAADKVAGAVAGVVGLLVGLWLLLPTLGDIPGWTSEQARTSIIADQVTDNFPQAPDTLQALRRLVGEDPFPQVFDRLRRAPDPGPPPATTGMTEETAARVRESVVKIEGEACGRLQEGTGFFVGDGVIVTNAHVVAGEDDSTLELADGTQADGTVVAFDPGRDIAILVTSANAPALPIGSGEVGDVGGVFGHPGGGPLEISPFEVGEEIAAQGRDIYDRTATQREVLVLAADLAPGDSGSALIDPAGEVVGVAFAVAPDRAGVAYALAVSELQAVLGGDLSQEAGTGDCLV